MKSTQFGIENDPFFNDLFFKSGLASRFQQFNESTKLKLQRLAIYFGLLINDRTDQTMKIVHGLNDRLLSVISIWNGVSLRSLMLTKLHQHFQMDY